MTSRRLGAAVLAIHEGKPYDAKILALPGEPRKHDASSRPQTILCGFEGFGEAEIPPSQVHDLPPLALGWKREQSEDGKYYYFHTDSGSSQWHRPVPEPPKPRAPSDPYGHRMAEPRNSLPMSMGTPHAKLRFKVGDRVECNVSRHRVGEKERS